MLRTQAGIVGTISEETQPDFQLIIYTFGQVLSKLFFFLVNDDSKISQNGGLGTIEPKVSLSQQELASK